MTNSSALKIIMDTITDNAIKYCPAPLRLSISLYKEKKKVILVVQDNGPGFEAKFANKIFKAYVCLDGELPHKKHGSGMGLFMAREIARKMGTDLNAGSKGKGDGFQFKLILKRCQNHDL